MKPLLMLDQVMLWIARGFAVLFLLFGLLVFWMELSIPPGYPKRSFSLGISLPVLAVIWLAGLWNLNLVFRLVLGGTATAGFVSTAYTFAECVQEYRAYSALSSDFFSQLVISFLLLIGLASVMWASVRPANAFRFNFNQHPSPLSSPSDIA